MGHNTTFRPPTEEIFDCFISPTAETEGKVLTILPFFYFQPGHHAFMLFAVMLSCSVIANLRIGDVLKSSIIWSHGSDSTTWPAIYNHAHMLMYWAGFSRIASPRERSPMDRLN